MSRIWPLVTIYTATTRVQATLDHHLWLWLLQSWSPCCHSCLSMASLWTCKTKVSSYHVCPCPPMALCPSKDKPMPYGTRPLLTLASPPPTLPYLLCFSHTSCSFFPKYSSPEYPQSPPPSCIRGIQMSPSQRGPLIILFKFHMQSPYCWCSTYTLPCPIFLHSTYLLTYNMTYLFIMFIIYLLHPKRASQGQSSLFWTIYYWFWFPS